MLGDEGCLGTRSGVLGDEGCLGTRSGVLGDEGCLGMRSGVLGDEGCDVWTHGVTWTSVFHPPLVSPSNDSCWRGWRDAGR